MTDTLTAPLDWGTITPDELDELLASSELPSVVIYEEVLVDPERLAELADSTVTADEIDALSLGTDINPWDLPMWDSEDDPTNIWK